MSSEVMPASALVAQCEADDAEGVLAALSELSDETRAEVWEVLRRPLSAVLGPDDRRGFTEDEWKRHIRTRALVALAVGPSDIVRRVGSWVFLPDSPSDLDLVLASRTPEWRDEFTVATLRDFASEPEVGLMGPFWWVWWQQLRQRERSGVLKRPRFRAALIRAAPA